ncbi:hypothetical protein ASU31_18320 [Pedobacter ginsenosidimutans]|uniref:Uncharacterized protein n=1 Tax=Pedobacter ginsenosidimutans TaxID=687842 RepID=A0A0T5VLF1_9SPHI|nr:hypothetical protein [Pedobacter ginsenosidimutans]KRT14625.1 hypothetical protein ASU31_18320 [Pedobacter ginsenosidimutans]
MLKTTKKIRLTIAGLALVCGGLTLSSAFAFVAAPAECTTICGPNPDYDCKISYSDGSYIYCTYSHSRPTTPTPVVAD